MWYDLTVQNQNDTGKLSAEVNVPADSAWFEGHFPGNPVLPGIAQLGMVFELIGIMFGASLRVKEVSRVRFKQMILPGDQVTVTAESKPARKGVFAFRITKKDELVCSGNMTVGTSA
jgi:3-hydroxymyristoyl/3-hydroxydecanoyl-(acyl carrier protein) dehydratase